MDLDAIWGELEVLPPTGGAGTIERRIAADDRVDLFIALTMPGRRRAVILGAPMTPGVGHEVLPQARGISLEFDAEDDRIRLQMTLSDPAFSSLFSVLASDIARATAESSTIGAASAFLARLRRWQRLLAVCDPAGLGWEAQRGLYGELWFLREELFGPLSAERAISAWTGPERAEQDFQFPACAVEVKTTGARQPQNLRINGERQLDPPANITLFLFHLSVDARPEGGETLPEMVHSVRRLVHEAPAGDLFEERLLQAGYLDIHAGRYAVTSYARREAVLYRVDEGFPRIRERDLPTGVGDVRYAVAASECRHFMVPLTDLRPVITAEMQ